MEELVSLGAFLKARRATLRPSDEPGPTGSSRRRVTGLRREEVAQAAAISVDYYTRLEQDRGGLVSTDVLDAVARGLRLDDSETAYLHDLARPGARRHDLAPEARKRVRAPVQRLLDSLAGPAILFGRGGDVLAWNRLGHRLFVDFDTIADPNWPRLLFLDPRLIEILPHHEDEARQTVAHLRAQAGRGPDDPIMRRLVEELSGGSVLFRTLWAQQAVHERMYGATTVLHPVVGRLDLHYEVLRLDDADHTLFAYSPHEPGSTTESALRRLDG